MLNTLIRNSWGALGDFSGALGALFGFAAIAFSIPPIQSPLSIWLWIPASILLFVRSAKLYGELEKQREVNAKPAPTMPLIDVIIRIRGTKDIFERPSPKEAGEEVSAAMVALQEKAINHELVIFGRDTRGQGAHPRQARHTVRLAILASYWANHEISYNHFLLDDQRGQAMDRSFTNADFVDLWFDERQIDKIWPPPRRSIAEYIAARGRKRTYAQPPKASAGPANLI